MIHESACEASVAPAATEVSFPYALGIIIGLSPNGIAKEGSLRRIEVTIPLTLEAEILNVPTELKELLIEALSMVKRLGVNRNRGLGRCSLTVK